MTILKAKYIEMYDISTRQFPEMEPNRATSLVPPKKETSLAARCV
jgi:hypothetical protein